MKRIRIFARFLLVFMLSAYILPFTALTAKAEGADEDFFKTIAGTYTPEVHIVQGYSSADEYWKAELEETETKERSEVMFVMDYAINHIVLKVDENGNVSGNTSGSITVTDRTIYDYDPQLVPNVEHYFDYSLEVSAQIPEKTTKKQFTVTGTIHEKYNETRVYTNFTHYDWQKASSWSTEKIYHFTTTNNWRSLYAKHILPFIGDELLQDIDYTRLQQHFNEADLSRKTYKNILQALKAMLTFAKSENKNLIIVDNFKDVGIIAANAPREKVFNVMTRAEVERVLGYMEDHDSFYRNLISLLLETGLRIEEALALKKENINYAKRHISVVSAIKRQTKYDSDKDAVGTKT